MAINQGTVIATARADNVNTAGQRIDMEETIHQLEPNDTKLVTLTNKLGTIPPAKNFKHEYEEIRPIENYTTLGTATSAAGSTLYPRDWDRIKNDCVLTIIDKDNGAIKDQIIATQSPTTASCTFVKWSGTTGSGGATVQYDVDDIVVIGNEAHAEGEDVPPAYTNNTVNSYVYATQSDRAIKATDVKQAIAYYDDFNRGMALARKNALLEYKRNMCLQGYVGKGTKESTTASLNRYGCSGLIELLTENIDDMTNVAGGFTLQTLTNMMGDVTPFSSSKSKILLAGNIAMSYISSWAESSLRTTPSESATWGIKIVEVITGFGNVLITHDPVLNSNTGLAGYAFLLDQDSPRKFYVQNLPVRLVVNIQNPIDIHNTEDVITGTFGYIAYLVERNAYAYGIH